VRGGITLQVSAKLREALFDALEAAGQTGVRLDVRQVPSIDKSRVALLVGANHRAAALGRTLVRTDHNGPVTRALSELRLLRGFHITEVVPPGDTSMEPATGSVPAPRSEV